MRACVCVWMVGCFNLNPERKGGRNITLYYVCQRLPPWLTVYYSVGMLFAVCAKYVSICLVLFTYVLYALYAYDIVFISYKYRFEIVLEYPTELIGSWLGDRLHSLDLIFRTACKLVSLGAALYICINLYSPKLLFLTFKPLLNML